MYSKMGGRGEPRNSNNLPRWAAEFGKRRRGIWPNLPRKTVGPSYYCHNLIVTDLALNLALFTQNMFQSSRNVCQLTLIQLLLLLLLLVVRMVCAVASCVAAFIACICWIVGITELLSGPSKPLFHWLLFNTSCMLIQATCNCCNVLLYTAVHCDVC